MSGTLDLPQDVLDDLRAEAERRGIRLTELVAKLAEELEAAEAPEPVVDRLQVLSFIGIGASNSGRTAAEADEMLAEGFGQS